MVWGLFPTDPLLGDEDKYYIFSKGTYKVGRKGCDVIIDKDKGVSRIHAEIVIDEMIALDPLQLQTESSNKISSKVRIRDCSKYGTSINKNLDSKVKVHELPNRETFLKDGDTVSFGTGNATYRFSFVPLIFLNLCSKPMKRNQVLKSKISSIGATVTENRSPDCTHVLVDDFMPLKENAIDSILAKKILILQNWVEFIAELNVCTDIPSCNPYAPTMSFEGLSVKVADPTSRESCLRGYTFLMESANKYKLKHRLKSLLEVAGAKVAPLEEFSPSSKGIEDEGNRVVHVVPAGSADTSQDTRRQASISNVNEINIVSAIVSGHLDSSTIVSPAVLVTLSGSTDETVVVESDVEMETASSVPNLVQEIESDEHEIKDDVIAVQNLHSVEQTATKVNPFRIREESPEYQTKADISTDCPVDKSREEQVEHYTVHKVENLESGNVDIIFSQDLIMRDTYVTTTFNSSVNGAVLNFKRFRKMGTESGNSFENLIPFSRDPYRDCDYGNEEVAESIKEEKMRKQMEAVAEDLFNNEKGKRRSAAGSLHGFLSRT